MATATATAGKTTTQIGRTRSQVNELKPFVWVGTDKRGVKIKGEYQAKNISMVKAELRRQGINTRSVKAKGKPLFGSSGRRIKPREIAVFSRMISVMMAAGVPLVHKGVGDQLGDGGIFGAKLQVRNLGRRARRIAAYVRPGHRQADRGRLLVHGPVGIQFGVAYAFVGLEHLLPLGVEVVLHPVVTALPAL